MKGRGRVCEIERDDAVLWCILVRLQIKLSAVIGDTAGKKKIQIVNRAVGTQKEEHGLIV